MAIIYEKEGHVRIMTMSNPDRMNALTVQDWLDMEAREEEFTADSDAWVLILTGAGDKAFCTGADLDSAIGEATKAETKIPPKHTRWFSHCYKPVIGAINGYAVAGGAELTFLTDIRIAAEHAQFGIQEVRWGLVPLGGSCVNAPRQIPFCKAMEMLLVGDRMTAQEALEWGLINYVVPKEDLMTKAMEMAERICENGPLAVRTVKEIALKSLSMSREMGYLAEMELGAPIFKTHDAMEGPMAFLEKRKPNFKGK
jgi:enoyl-CoA hydratase